MTVRVAGMARSCSKAFCRSRADPLLSIVPRLSDGLAILVQIHIDRQILLAPGDARGPPRPFLGMIWRRR